MKLAIYTQILENYGAHAWDGEGECPQRWKNKGGEIYLVEHLSPNDAIMATQPDGILGRVEKAVTTANEAFEEYVVTWELLDDFEPVGEEWEHPWKIIETEDGFQATMNIPRDWSWNENADADITGVVHTKVFDGNGGTEHGTAMYVYKDGSKKSYEQIYGAVA